MKKNIILFCALFSTAAYSMETSIVTPRISDQEEDDEDFVVYEYGSRITSCLRGIIKKQLEAAKAKAAGTTNEIEKTSATMPCARL